MSDTLNQLPAAPGNKQTQMDDGPVCTFCGLSKGKIVRFQDWGGLFCCVSCREAGQHGGDYPQQFHAYLILLANGLRWASPSTPENFMGRFLGSSSPRVENSQYTSPDLLRQYSGVKLPRFMVRDGGKAPGNKPTPGQTEE